jgi:hypothetical protein
MGSYSYMRMYRTRTRASAAGSDRAECIIKAKLLLAQRTTIDRQRPQQLSHPSLIHQ